MSRIFFTFIFWLICLQNTFAAHSNHIQVTLYADEGYPPYSYTENNQLKGIYIDIIKAAQKYLPEYDLILQPIPWKRGLHDMETGTAFGIVPPYYIKERSYMELSHPLNAEDVTLFCLPEAITSSPMHFPKDFKGKLIGINSGFSLSENFVEAQAKKLISVEEGKDNEINLRKISSHRIDCYANDRYSVLYTLKKLQTNLNAEPYIKKLRLIEVYEISKKDAFIGYSKSFKAIYRNDFIRKMNSAIDKLHADGEIETILKKNSL